MNNYPSKHTQYVFINHPFIHPSSDQPLPSIKKVMIITTNINRRQMSSLSHPYHLVTVSPWPILMSIALLLLGLIICSWLTHRLTSFNYVILCVAFTGLTTYQWFRDIIREAQGGYHTKVVQQGIYLSFLIFLVTEVMLFFSFFWAFFHSSLAPGVELGCVWPKFWGPKN